MTPSESFMKIFDHDEQFRGLMRRLFEVAITHSFDAIMISENKPGYPIVFVNQSFTDMTGYAHEELIGQSPTILQGPKTDRLVLERLRRDISAGKIFHGQAVNYRKDGSEFIMEWKIAPVRNESGDISHFLALQRSL
ncbi:MAG: PAS domain-containing protein [Deltaproteobacteria bacterium]|nr:PAS domain-containing protein [Deltaproteobacteria bacterium]